MGATDDFARWLKRLPLAEQMQLRRADEMAEDPKRLTEKPSDWRQSSRACERCGAPLKMGNPNLLCGRCLQGYRPRTASQSTVKP